VLILDPGEEAFSSITGFAVQEGINAASLTAIGAFSKAAVGWFDLESKTYRKIPVDEQCEVLSGIGDIALDDRGQPSLHVHVVLGLSDGSWSSAQWPGAADARSKPGGDAHPFAPQKMPRVGHRID
jgi:predicted DNA-binding protein with PD1-like motif